jgi:hypothetical protein
MPPIESEINMAFSPDAPHHYSEESHAGTLGGGDLLTGRDANAILRSYHSGHIADNFAVVDATGAIVTKPETSISGKKTESDRSVANPKAVADATVQPQAKTVDASAATKTGTKDGPVAKSEAGTHDAGVPPASIDTADAAAKISAAGSDPVSAAFDKLKQALQHPDDPRAMRIALSEMGGTSDRLASRSGKNLANSADISNALTRLLPYVSR